MRVNVNLPDELIKMIDLYAVKNGVTRTSAMVFLLSQKLTEEIRRFQEEENERRKEEL